MVFHRPGPDPVTAVLRDPRVPQKPHLTVERTCAKLPRAGKDVVVEHCTGRAPHTILLTTLDGWNRRAADDVVSGAMLRLLVLLATAAGTPQLCPTRTVGPGVHREGGTSGAACLLAAYQRGCRRAEYVLSSVGQSVFVVENFSVERVSGRCSVVVFRNVAVVAQPSRVSGRTCARLRRIGSDVVADRCTGDPPSALSLTKLG